MHTQFLIFPPTKPPFPARECRKSPSVSASLDKPRSARRPGVVRGPSAIDLAAVFAGFRVAQVYVGHAPGDGA